MSKEADPFESPYLKRLRVWRERAEAVAERDAAIKYDMKLIAKLKEELSKREEGE